MTRATLSLIAALTAAVGVFLLCQPATPRTLKRRLRLTDWMRQAGVVGVGGREFVVVESVVFATTSASMWLLFGAIIPAVLIGGGAMAAPLAIYRRRRATLVEQARDSWPSMLEELRLQVGALGRSVPAALLDVGLRSPIEPVRLAFVDAHREWLLSTDFPRVIRFLQDRLASSTADSVLDTLLVANEIGGTDVDRRLARLAADRQVDLRHRHEALSRQSGVRFARWFVLLVPFAMALIGLGIGDGRGAYASASGQLVGGLAVGLVGGCWWWSGLILRLPADRRIMSLPRPGDS